MGISPRYIHVVYREVNDSCRQFVHKHVPVTLLETGDTTRRGRRRSILASSHVLPRRLPACLAASRGRYPTSGMAEENHTPFRDIRISFIHTNFGTNLDLRELSATRWQSAETTLESEQRRFDIKDK